MYTYKMSIPRGEPIGEFWLLVSSDASTPTQSCQRRVGMPRDLSGRRSLPEARPPVSHNIRGAGEEMTIAFLLWYNKEEVAMSEKEEPIARQIVFPPATLRRLEHDAQEYGRSFNDQVVYVLTVGHRELEYCPPMPKARHKHQKGSADVDRDGSGA